jgi:hypothetical protein
MNIGRIHASTTGLMFEAAHVNKQGRACRSGFGRKMRATNGWKQSLQESGRQPHRRAGPDKTACYSFGREGFSPAGTRNKPKSLAIHEKHRGKGQTHA